MSTHRSQRSADVKLGDDLEELTATIRRNTVAETRLSLVYRYALKTEEPRDIQTLAVPALAMVSKQVRAESLPVFFNECHFSLTLWSNGWDAAALEKQYVSGRLQPLSIPTSFQKFKNAYHEQSRRWYNVDQVTMDFLATVRNASKIIREETRAWLGKMAGTSTVVPAFRNIDLRILSTRATLRYWQIRPGSTFPAYPGILADLQVRVPVATRMRPVVEAAARDTETTEEAHEYMQAWVTDTIDRIVASRERFVGFTLVDLDEISVALQYWPSNKE